MYAVSTADRGPIAATTTTTATGQITRHLARLKATEIRVRGYIITRKLERQTAGRSPMDATMRVLLKQHRAVRNGIDNLSTMIAQLDSAATNQMIVTAMAIGSNALAVANSHATLEKADEVVSQWEEQRDAADDISDILATMSTAGTTDTDVSDAELELELNLLLSDEHQRTALAHHPVASPRAATTVPNEATVHLDVDHFPDAPLTTIDRTAVGVGAGSGAGMGAGTGAEASVGSLSAVRSPTRGGIATAAVADHRPIDPPTPV